MLMPSAALGPVSAPAIAIVVVGAQVALPSPAGVAASSVLACGTSLPSVSTWSNGWMLNSVDAPPPSVPDEPDEPLSADLSPQPASASAAANPTTSALL